MRSLLWLSLPAILLAQEVRLTPVVTGVASPTDIQHAGDGSGRLFVVQQSGLIRVVREGSLLERPFLDIRSKVTAGGERGLLGLAFPPEYSGKRHFYVNYTDRGGNTVVARYRLTSDPDVADPNSEEVILNINQPFSNHNGGQIRFGPDGFLYIGMGDGGSAGDPQNHAQRRDSLLGKMLRIDTESGATPYRIPPGNPFAASDTTRPEIWALGLRNPWRFWFDRETRDLWIADVGQNRAEEVNFTPAASTGGENYGWNQMEGLQCYRPGCRMEGFVLPVHEYVQGQDCSVTGGSVYRGRRYPSLRGMYIYGDYCSGRIWALRREGDRWVNRLLLDSQLNVSTFGEDESGEVYLGGHTSATVYALSAVSAAPSFTAESVVNAASNAGGLVPGSLATIFATGLREASGIVEAGALPLPTSLDSVTVTINGVEAPLLAVTAQQVNLQVPWSVPATRATVMIRRGDVASAPVEVAVQPAQPGIFTSDGSAAIATDASFGLITAAQPAAPESIVILYATGLGPVDNTPPIGGAAPAEPLARTRVTPSVRFNGMAAEVLFSGLAPGFAGLYQLNVRLPAGLPSGAVEAVMESGGIVSRPARVFVR